MTGRITEEVWDAKKTEIVTLYRDEEWPLKQVLKKVVEDCFHPSESQLRGKLKKWRVRKPSRRERVRVRDQHHTRSEIDKLSTDGTRRDEYKELALSPGPSFGVGSGQQKHSTDDYTPHLATTTSQAYCNLSIQTDCPSCSGGPVYPPAISSVSSSPLEPSAVVSSIDNVARTIPQTTYGYVQFANPVPPTAGTIPISGRHDSPSTTQFYLTEEVFSNGTSNHFGTFYWLPNAVDQQATHYYPFTTPCSMQGPI